MGYFANEVAIVADFIYEPCFKTSLSRIWKNVLDAMANSDDKSLFLFDPANTFQLLTSTFELLSVPFHEVYEALKVARSLLSSRRCLRFRYDVENSQRVIAGHSFVKSYPILTL